MPLTDRIVLITGAGRGIGAAAAVRFARHGARVALLARSSPELEGVAQRVREAGGTPLVLSADVADAPQVANAFARLESEWHGLDVLVNSAGVAHLGAFADMPIEAFDRLVAVNVRGVFLACKAAWPLMISRGGGTIVNVSSRAATDPFTGFAAYGGSKAFVETFTRAIADEGQSANIRAFGVAPGAVATRMLFDLFPSYPESSTLSADEVAAAIESLCHPGAGVTSGHTIAVSR